MVATEVRALAQRSGEAASGTLTVPRIEVIRIISARRADRTERQRYEEQDH